MKASEMYIKAHRTLDLEITPYERKVMTELKHRAMAEGRGNSDVAINATERLLLEKLSSRSLMQRVLGA